GAAPGQGGGGIGGVGRGELVVAHVHLPPFDAAVGIALEGRRPRREDDVASGQAREGGGAAAYVEAAYFGHDDRLRFGDTRGHEGENTKHEHHDAHGCVSS